MKRITLSLLVLLSTGTAFAIPPEEIVRRMEANEVHETSLIEGAMVITDRFGIKKVEFISYTEGEERALIEFTSADEKGQKILRTANEIYLFYPDAEEVIRIQGAALRESVLGSDFSYEDMTGEKGIMDTYDVVLAGEETVDGFRCYRLELSAKGRDVAYARETWWIDAELFATRRVFKYSLSGKLLKELEVLAFTEKDGKVFPSRLLMSDTMKKRSSTEFEITSIEIGIDLPKGIFSLEELSW